MTSPANTAVVRSIPRKQGWKHTLSCGCVVIDYDEDANAKAMREIVRSCRACRDDNGVDWDRVRDERDGY